MKLSRYIAAILTLAIAPHVQAYDKPYIGDPQTAVIQGDDTLPYLARDHNLGYIEILAANQSIDPWLPEEGTKITLPTRHILPDIQHKGLVINLPEMRLYAFLNESEKPLSYPLGIGREGLETPLGETTVRAKSSSPTWRPTKRMREEDPDLPEIMGPGKDNPLGTHALYLGWPEYLIHGTNRPFGIGRRVSSGCIRMYPEAIKNLYALTPKDTLVTVIDQPIKAAWIDNKFYLEAHTTMAQSIELEATGTITFAPLTEDEKTYIKDLAGDASKDINWDTINDIVKKRTGTPIEILTRTPSINEDKDKDKGETISAKVTKVN